ncbi:DUF4307 domain-containing protein [Nocardioides litoris]|uniref:DUF4307 domain-containing protein n=1 Tax=Nocardioides litoris TaxID=1926648 RepID=UPI001120E15F|nr:DUF4307 domain-containing protein [Nocardioides litoris]
MTSPDPVLAERYGAPSPHRRRLFVGAVVAVLVAAAGWLAWVVLVQASPDVASGNLTFDTPTSDREITARFTIDMAEGVDEATCTLEAYGKQGATRVLVGSRTFTVPAGTTRVEETVATERRAEAVELVGCTAPGQQRPR